MLPPTSLVARGPALAALFGIGIIVLSGNFWTSAKDLKVKCRGEDATVATCAVGAFRSAVLAVMVVGAFQVYNAAMVVPVPKARRSEELSRRLSPDFTHMAYTQPDEKGYHHILYLNHPTTPSKVRFSMADPGIHSSDLVIRDHDDLSFWRRRQAADEDWYVDIERDDEMPSFWNDFQPADASLMADNYTSHMIDYFSANSVNGSCFLMQYLDSAGIVNQGIIKVAPSRDGSENYPALECGNDPSAFTVRVPLS